MRSEIRKDYIQEKYVIIAPWRGKRPHDTERPECFAPPPKKGECVFCPKNTRKLKTLLTLGANDEEIKIIANKYPAVSLDNPNAYGQQEVVIETPNPEKQIDEFSPRHIAKILEAYAIRTAAISQNKKIEYILIFKNHGGRAGASLRHSHSQIFAASFLPPHIFDKSQKQQEYKLKHGRCVYCDVIKKEKNGPRRIFEDNNVFALCPWAPIHNYEAWILPKRHLDNITLLSDKEKLSFAKILKQILKKINKLGLPYNFYFHQVINDEDQHLYMKITPRGSIWAGVEIGSGITINPIPPEQSAKYYRG